MNFQDTKQDYGSMIESGYDYYGHTVQEDIYKSFLEEQEMREHQEMRKLKTQALPENTPEDSFIDSAGGFLKEVFVGGASDALLNTIDALGFIEDVASSPLEALGIMDPNAPELFDIVTSFDDVPEGKVPKSRWALDLRGMRVEKSDDLTTNIFRELFSFALGFGATGAAFKGLNIANKFSKLGKGADFVRSTVVGEVASQLVEDPTTSIFDMFSDETKEVISYYNSENPTEDEFKDRMKKLGGGVLAGAAAEGVFKLVSKGFGKFVKNKAAAELIAEQEGNLDQLKNVAEDVRTKANEVSFERATVDEIDGNAMIDDTGKSIRPTRDVFDSPAMAESRDNLKMLVEQSKTPEEFDKNFAGFLTKRLRGSLVSEDSEIEGLIQLTTKYVSEFDNVVTTTSDNYTTKLGKQRFTVDKAVAKRMADKVYSSMGATTKELQELTENMDYKELYRKSRVTEILSSTFTTEAQGLAKQIASGVADSKTLYQFNRANEAMNLLQSKVLEGRHYWGRTGRLFQEPVEALKLRGSDEYYDGIMPNGDKKATIQKAEDLIKIQGDPEAVKRYMIMGVKQPFIKQLVNVRAMSMLSAPTSTAIQFIGNSITLAIRNLEDLGTDALTGIQTGTTREKMTNFVNGMSGQLQGLANAVKLPFFTAEGRNTTKEALNFIKKGDIQSAQRMLLESDQIGTAWKSGMINQSVLDPRTATEIGADINPNISYDDIDSFWKLASSGMGLFMRSMSYKPMMVVDEIFKSIHFHGTAFRKFGKEHLDNIEAARGHNFKDYADMRLSNLQGDEAMGLMDEAAYFTFQNELGTLGQIGENVLRAVPMAKLVVPFYKTPTNIISFVGDRSNVFSKSFREAIKSPDPAVKNRALVQYATGASLFMSAAYMFSAPDSPVTITGGFSEEERDFRRAAGESPYSFKIGDTYVPYNRLDPVGMFFGLTADFLRYSNMMDKENEEAFVSAMMGSVVDNMTSKLYLKTITDVLKIFTDKNYDAEKFGVDFAASFIPNATKTIVTELGEDRYVRDTEKYASTWDYLDKVTTKLPWASHSVPAKKNIFGEDLEYDERFLEPINPVYVSKKKKDVVMDELIRVKYSKGQPRKSLGNVDLTKEQYHKYLELSGEGLRDNLAKLMDSDSYKNTYTDQSFTGKEGSRQIAIDYVVEKHREAALYKLMEQYPELKDAILQDKRGKQLARLFQM